MAAEKTFENKIKKYIESESIGGWWVKFFANSYTRKGIPDILCCINGYFLAIEVKAQNGHPSPLQFYEIDKLRKAGAQAFIVYPSGFDQLKAIIDNLKEDYFSSSWPIELK